MMTNNNDRMTIKSYNDRATDRMVKNDKTSNIPAIDKIDRLIEQR